MGRVQPNHVRCDVFFSPWSVIADLIADWMGSFYGASSILGHVRSLESKSQASVVQIPWFQQTSSDATEFDTSPHSFRRPTRTHPKELGPDAGAFNMSRLWRDPHGLCSSSERTRPAVRVLLDMPLEVNNKCWHRAEMLNPSNGNPGLGGSPLKIITIYIYI